MTALNQSLFALAQHEIVDFHVAVERWFSGAESDSAAFDRIAQALAADFSMTTPDGRCIAEPLVSDWLRKARGCRQPDFRIWIERVRLVIEDGDLAVLIYDECQHLEGNDTRRHATAVFRRAPAAPLGVQWLRVHETWAASASVANPLPTPEKP
jgi:hypothetical protein